MPMPAHYLLLRGLSREQRHWGDFPAALSRATGARVHCLDAPGFGTEHVRRSPRSVGAITDDIRERFMADHAAGDWAVVGISLGGMVALDWCARYGEDFQGSVVINTSARPSPPQQRFRPGALPALTTSRFRTAEANERAILAISSNNTAVDRDTLAVQWAHWAGERTPAQASVANQAAAALRFAVPRRLAVPLLVLASRGDRLVSHRCSERVAQQLSAELRVHATAGHDLPLDEPTWVARQIADWQPSV